MMIRTLTTFALAGAALVSLPACQYSADRYSYESTYISPKTVFVTDVSTGETIWTYDIPPQQVLAVEFDADTNWDLTNAPSGYATSLQWAVYPIDAIPSKIRANHYWGAALEEGRMELEGRPVRIGFSVSDPIDPSDVPIDRTPEEIEKDLPEPGEAELPEPVVPAGEAEAPAEKPAE